MLDIKTGEQIDALYEMVQIKNGTRIVKFQTQDIKRIIRFHKWYVNKYKEGLLLEIRPLVKVYNWESKKVEYKFE